MKHLFSFLAVCLMTVACGVPMIAMDTSCKGDRVTLTSNDDLFQHQDGTMAVADTQKVSQVFHNLYDCRHGAIKKKKLNTLDMRWTFGAHEPFTMYRRIGKRSTGGIDGNAKWVKPWLDWFDSESPALMQELGLNWLHCRFYKGMGWEVEKEDFPNVKKFVSNCHAHGVHALAYVQFGTLYPEIMKAEIPDVMSWAQTDENGHPHLYTNKQYFRHMPCLNCTEWLEYLKRMCTIALTEGGFDGIMLDNVFSYHNCYCERCRKSFHEYLSSLPDKEERFGFRNIDGMDIPRYVQESYFLGEIRDPVIQAYMEWRKSTLTKAVKTLHDHVKSVKPDAVFSGNIMPIRYMSRPFEEGFADRTALSSMMEIVIGQNEKYPSVRDGRINSRIRELKMSKELGTIVVALCDSDAMMTPEQEKHYLLPLYEDLVFGGVPTDRTIISPKAVEGFIDRTKLESRKPLLKAFNDMVNSRRADFEAPSYMPVRLFMPDRELAFSALSARALVAAEEILTRRHVPWGYIVSTPEAPFKVPEGTELIIVPGQRCLSEAQRAGIVEWARKGGKLVVTGDSGRYDSLNAQYLVNPLLPELEGLANVSLRQDEDRVEPCHLAWTMNVGAPADHGDALLRDIAGTGYSLPFEIDGCPETVAVDVRRKGKGYVFHFVNYLPSELVEGVRVRRPGGKWKEVATFSEYGSAAL